MEYEVVVIFHSNTMVNIINADSIDDIENQLNDMNDDELISWFDGEFSEREYQIRKVTNDN